MHYGGYLCILPPRRRELVCINSTFFKKLYISSKKYFQQNKSNQMTARANQKNTPKHFIQIKKPASKNLTQTKKSTSERPAQIKKTLLEHLTQTKNLHQKISHRQKSPRQSTPHKSKKLRQNISHGQPTSKHLAKTKIQTKNDSP